MTKMIIFGGNGFLGTEIKDYFQKKGYEVYTPTHDEIDIVDYTKVEKFLEDLKPDVVINSAGKVGKPNIDRCETHKEDTVLTNVNGAVHIALACQKLGIYNVYLGSGCIYQGNNEGKGFSEEDVPNYDGSFYSRTKIKTQELLSKFDVLQLRIRMPILSKPNPRNFIDKLAKYSHVIDEENSVTVVEDMLEAMNVLITKRVNGIFNMVNPGVLRHHELLAKYKKIVDPEHKFTPISMQELLQKFTCTGRSNCELDSHKLEKYIVLPDIEKRIDEVLQAYKAAVK